MRYRSHTRRPAAAAVAAVEARSAGKNPDVGITVDDIDQTFADIVAQRLTPVAPARRPLAVLLREHIEREG